MTGKWLSVPAVLWAMDDAADVPPELVSTLLAVARYAGEDGRAAYPSASTVAAITRKTERQAKRDLARLEKRGLLLPGDKDVVKDIRADRRPKVRDLPMPRGDTYDTPSTRYGVTPRVRRGDIQSPNGVTHMSPEEVLKTSRTASASRARAGSARASALASQTPSPRWCAYCRSDDHEHCTEVTPGWTGPDCQCPCVEGKCYPCWSADCATCTGVAYWSECGKYPCECRKCHDVDVIWRAVFLHEHECPVHRKDIDMREHENEGCPVCCSLQLRGSS